MSTATTPAPRRIEIFDGLRGIAIVLVVLSHGWTVWPSEYLLTHRPLSSLFASGNFAVSVFFVVGAFLFTRSMLERSATPRGFHPLVAFMRRYVRLTAPLAALLVVVLLVTVFDDTEPYAESETGASILGIVTYTWNWYVRANPLTARPDLGHLWYLSVDMQAFVLIAILVWMLRRRPAWLVVTLGVLLCASEIWTLHVYEQEGYYQALLRTSVRIDAPLAGALAAAAVPYLSRFRPHAPAMGVVGLLSLVPLLYLTSTNEGYFTWPGLALDAALGLFVVSAVLARIPRPVSVVMGFGPLTALGRRSLSIYAWHYPIFYFSSRHNYQWDWWWRTALALGLTVIFVVLSEWLVERRVQRALQAPGWRELDYGFPAYFRRTWKTWRTRRATPAHEDGPPPRQHTSA